MEAIFHPVTYDTIGFVEKADGGGGFFAWTNTEYTGQTEPTEAFYRTKRAAIAFLKRITKSK